MDKQLFLEQIREQFEETTPEEITLQTVFKQLEEWSSMHALLIIALIDAEYNVSFTGEDLQKCQTIEDIFTTVSSRMGGTT